MKKKEEMDQQQQDQITRATKMRHRTLTKSRARREQIQNTATIMALPTLPIDIKKNITTISRKNIQEKFSIRTFMVNKIIIALIENLINNCTLIGLDAGHNTVLTIRNMYNMFNLQIGHDSFEGDPQKAFQVHAVISFPLQETQRLGNILYYLLGTYRWNFAVMTPIHIQDSEHLLRSVLNEEVFKISVYKRVEKNLKDMRWMKCVALTTLEHLTRAELTHLNNFI